MFGMKMQNFQARISYDQIAGELDTIQTYSPLNKDAATISRTLNNWSVNWWSTSNQLVEAVYRH